MARDALNTVTQDKIRTMWRNGGDSTSISKTLGITRNTALKYRPLSAKVRALKKQDANLERGFPKGSRKKRARVAGAETSSIGGRESA